MFNESFSVIVLEKSIPVTEAGNREKCSPVRWSTEVQDTTVSSNANTGAIEVLKAIYLPSATR
jgi:hypothetical protein